MKTVDIHNSNGHKLTSEGNVIGKNGKVMTGYGKNGKEATLRIGIIENGKEKRRTKIILEIVLLHFVGPKPFSESIPVHKNGDYNDRRAENLEWSTNVPKGKEEEDGNEEDGNEEDGNEEDGNEEDGNKDEAKQEKQTDIKTNTNKKVELGKEMEDENKNNINQKIEKLIKKINDEIGMKIFKNNLLQSAKNEKYRRDIRPIPGYKNAAIDGIFQIYSLYNYKQYTLRNDSIYLRYSEEKNNNVRNIGKWYTTIHIAAFVFLGRPLDDEGIVKFKNNTMNIKNSNYTDLIWIKKEEIIKVPKSEKKEIPPLVLIQQEFTEGFYENKRWRCLTKLFPNYRVYEDQNIVSDTIIHQKPLACGHKRLELVNFLSVTERIRLHKLIAVAYLGLPTDPIYKYVIHIDTTKDENGQYVNNHFSNLKWWYEPELLDHDEWIDYYLDSNYKVNLKNGEIKSFKTGISKTLKQRKTDDGYSKVSMGNKNILVNRAVALTCNPEEASFEKIQSHHKNSDRSNNSADNLTMVTPSDNSKARQNPKTKRKTKIVIQMDKDDNIIREFQSAKEVSEVLKYKSVRKIRDWAQHQKIMNGFKWKYKTYEPKTDELGIKIIGDFDGYILNFPDHILYSSGVIVNNYGHIMSLNRDISYPKITLTYKGNVKKFFIHRLLALFYVPGRTEEKWMVNHKNSIRDDFRLENLEWVTPSENNIHGFGKAVLQLDMKTGETINKFNCLADAAESVGKKRKCGTNIAKVCEGASLYAYGFNWEWAQ
jgi:hypothetical protein